MTLTINEIYIGPFGRPYRVEHIDESCGVRWVTVREVADGTYGTISFAMAHAHGFLKPMQADAR